MSHIKLKATNEQDRQTNENSHTQTTVSKERGREITRVHGVNYMGTEDLTLGGKYTKQMQMIYHMIVHLKPT